MRIRRVFSTPEYMAGPATPQPVLLLAELSRAERERSSRHSIPSALASARLR